MARIQVDLRDFPDEAKEALDDKAKQFGMTFTAWLRSVLIAHAKPVESASPMKPPWEV